MYDFSNISGLQLPNVMRKAGKQAPEGPIVTKR